MVAKATAAADVPGAEGDNLSGDMRTLTTVIRDLEDQLDRMMATNEATKQDLEQERKRRLESQSRVDELQERLRRSEQGITDTEALRAELSHLNQERTRLAGIARETTQQLEESQREQQRQSRLIERLRKARAEALEEVSSVEAQFERAMQLVSHLRAQLTVASEGRDSALDRLRASEEAQRQMQQERDVLTAEVEQSRAALDEIRRSLVDSFGSAPVEAGAQARAAGR